MKCPWAERNRFVVNPDGQVWPCCYFANSDFTARGRNADFLQNRHYLNKMYNDKRDHMNVANRPAHEILQDSWFDALHESMQDSDTRHPTCRHHCCKQ